MDAMTPAMVKTPPTMANTDVRKVDSGMRFTLTFTMNGDRSKITNKPGIFC